MPLPSHCSISLYAHSRFDADTGAKPKMAMIVRLTEEALDALQDLSSGDRMEFALGDRPGIFVRDKSFPMRYDKENHKQELFVRTTVPTRMNSNAPLKLSANVVGRLVVEPELTDRFVQQLHNATAAENRQKSERKTVLVDAPPTSAGTVVVPKGAAKRKAPPKSTPRSSAPTIVKSYAVAVPSPQPTPSATPMSNIPKEIVIKYRLRLIHYLALGSATAPDAVKDVGGVEVDGDNRRKILELLHEVAEQEQVGKKIASASQDVKWRLKPQTWLEVRPYQYAGYTDNVRTSVARSARTWLGSLKIPESDAAWEHVKYRSNGGTNTSASATPANQRPANSTTSAIVKAKAGKARETKAKDTEVKVKSETLARAPVPALVPSSAPASAIPERSVLPASVTATFSSTRIKEENDPEKEEGELSGSETSPPISHTPPHARRLPGSRPSGISAPPTSIYPPLSSQPNPSAPMGPPARKTVPASSLGLSRMPPDPSERANAIAASSTAVNRKSVPQSQAKDVTRVKKEELPSAVRSDNGTTRDHASVASRGADKARREREREKESDRESVKRERESDRESVRSRELKMNQLEKERTQRARELERDREREKERAKVMKGKERERDQKEKDRDKERLREEKGKEKGKEREQIPKSSPRLGKRKLSSYTDSSDESSDWGIVHPKFSKKQRSSTESKAGKSKGEHDREGNSVPPKASISAAKTIKGQSVVIKKPKREHSPLLPEKNQPSVLTKKAVEGSATTSSKVARKDVKGSDKDRDESKNHLIPTKLFKRHTSPKYTSSSSEEEKEMEFKKPKTVQKGAAPLASEKTRYTTKQDAQEMQKIRHSLHPAQTPKNESLRSRYSQKYAEYLDTVALLVAQKNKLNAALQHGLSSTSGESDAEADIMSMENLEALSARHQRLHEELEDIRKKYIA